MISQKSQISRCNIKNPRYLENHAVQSSWSPIMLTRILCSCVIIVTVRVSALNLFHTFGYICLFCLLPPHIHKVIPSLTYLPMLRKLNSLAMLACLVLKTFSTFQMYWIYWLIKQQELNFDYQIIYKMLDLRSSSISRTLANKLLHAFSFRLNSFILFVMLIVFLI